MSFLEWKVGDRVVCLDEKWAKGCIQYVNRIPPSLRRGSVYTVKDIKIGEGFGIDRVVSKHVMVLLSEALNPELDGFFDARRFRRVVPRKTDISVFTAMLGKSKIDALHYVKSVR